MISFSIHWFDLLAVQGTLKNLLQHHSSKASILWLSAFFIVHLSHLYMTTGKATASSWFLLSTNSVHEGRGGRAKGHFSGCGRLMESSSFGEQRLFQLQGLCTCCSLCLMLFEKWVPLYPSDLSSRATSSEIVTTLATVASFLVSTSFKTLTSICNYYFCFLFVYCILSPSDCHLWEGRDHVCLIHPHLQPETQ